MAIDHEDASSKRETMLQLYAIAKKPVLPKGAEAMLRHLVHNPSVTCPRLDRTCSSSIVSDQLVDWRTGSIPIQSPTTRAGGDSLQACTTSFQRVHRRSRSNRDPLLASCMIVIYRHSTVPKRMLISHQELMPRLERQQKIMQAMVRTLPSRGSYKAPRRVCAVGSDGHVLCRALGVQAPKCTILRDDVRISET